MEKKIKPYDLETQEQESMFCSHRTTQPLGSVHPYTRRHSHNPIIHRDAGVWCQHPNLFGKFCLSGCASSEVVLFRQVVGTRGWSHRIHAYLSRNAHLGPYFWYTPAFNCFTFGNYHEKFQSSAWEDGKGLRVQTHSWPIYSSQECGCKCLCAALPKTSPSPSSGWKASGKRSWAPVRWSSPSSLSVLCLGDTFWHQKGAWDKGCSANAETVPHPFLSI